MIKKKKKKFNNLFVFLVFLFTIFIFLLSFMYYPYSFLVKEYKIVNKNIPDNFVGLKIIHFSDIHYGTTIKEREFENIVKEINKFNPDIVIFTGDLFDKNISYSKEELEIFKNYLKDINGDLGKFAVTGNHDYYNKHFNSVMDEAGFKVLKNNHVLVFNKGITPIFIGGIPSSLKDKQNYEELFSYFEQISESEVIPSYKILLMHEPDNIIKIKNYKVDLVLAGHSHNGQVRFPFIGAIVTPKGAKNYYNEYYKVNNTDLYISGGVGTSKLPIRFLSKQSINLYRLYNN